MTVIKDWFHSAVFKKVSIAPLVTFRILFGVVMLASIVRFWLNGWIDLQYIQPDFHFKYFGFHWIPEPSTEGYYVLFGIMALSALGIALGAFYRLNALVFFLVFSHIELIDASYYLNHYYFISIVALILVFLPAHRAFSLDVKSGNVARLTHVSALNINILKFQLGLVYVFAGIAKLNADWLLEAMPLKIWLPAQDAMPLIGQLFAYEWTAYAMSWGGAFYDLFIVFFLLWAPTRKLAYAAVVVFHLLTWFLFQIGMFPFIMMGATLIFFSGDFHVKLLSLLGYSSKGRVMEHASLLLRKPAISLVMGFAVFQFLFPLRYLVYDGNPFWHEQGYRFGWRVMLAEKAGYASFMLKDAKGRTMEIDNSEFLTPVQEKMMSTQPDFMIQYAKMLKQHFATQGLEDVSVHADVYVTLNGRSSQRFIDPAVDLASLEDSWKQKNWILPLNQQKG